MKRLKLHRLHILFPDQNIKQVPEMSKPLINKVRNKLKRSANELRSDCFCLIPEKRQIKLVTRELQRSVVNYAGPAVKRKGERLPLHGINRF